MATPARQQGLHLQEISASLFSMYERIKAEQNRHGDSEELVFTGIIASTVASELRNYGSQGGITHYAEPETGAFVLIWLHSNNDSAAERRKLEGQSKIRSIMALRYNALKDNPTRHIYAIITVPWAMRIFRVFGDEYYSLTAGGWSTLQRDELHPNVCRAFATMALAPPLGSMAPFAYLTRRIRELARLGLGPSRATPLDRATQQALYAHIDVSRIVGAQNAALGRQELATINAAPEDELSDEEGEDQAVPPLDPRLVDDEGAKLYLAIVTLMRVFAVREQGVYTMAKAAFHCFHNQQFQQARNCFRTAFGMAGEIKALIQAEQGHRDE